MPKVFGKRGMDNQSIDEMEYVINKYSDRLFRLAIVMLKNEEDAKDVLQNVLIKYLQKRPKFQSEEHRKAWLLRVCSNECRDFLRYRKRHMHISFEENKEALEQFGAEPDKTEVIALMQELPCKYKEVLHLFYVEGYQADEIAEMLHISQAAVRKRMQRGREQLKMELTV